MRLRALAPGKVNLSLWLGPRRADGRHELVTLFESVSLADVLELSTGGVVEDEVSCAAVAGPNIVSAALRELRAHGWGGPPVTVTIEKRIPVAAGMGGGSADAAALLRLAERLEPVGAEVQHEIATALGADVASQVEPGLVLGLGAGEDVQPQPPIAAHELLIVPQPQPLATAEVYREADRLRLPRTRDELAAKREGLLEALGADARLRSEVLINDLEPASLSLCPRIADALQAVREAGADHTFVCGSGPTVAGLYWELDRAPDAARTLADRFPGTTAASPVSAEFGSPQFA